jgi:flagellar hook protein FlgE
VLPSTPSGLQVLNCSNFTSTGTATSQITFKCGLAGNVGDSVTRAITVYDSSGTPRSLNYVFTRLADVGGLQAWNLEIQAPSGSTVVGAYSAGNPSNSTVAAPVTIQFDASGCPASFTYNAVSSSTPPALNITCPGSNTISASMNLGTVGQPNGVIQIAGGESRLQVIENGNKPGNFSSIFFDETGNIYARFDNGQTTLVGALAVGVFNNPDGLVMLDQGLFLTNTTLSGSPTYSFLGQSLSGNVAVGALESSTIETIPQMAKMIERQQQFNNMVTVYNTINDMLELLNTLDS